MFQNSINYVKIYFEIVSDQVVQSAHDSGNKYAFYSNNILGTAVKIFQIIVQPHHTAYELMLFSEEVRNSSQSIHIAGDTGTIS